VPKKFLLVIPFIAKTLRKKSVMTIDAQKDMRQTSAAKQLFKRRTSMATRIAFLVTCLFLTPALAFSQDAAALYQRHCATCHEASAQTRAPSRDVLRQLTPERILDALEAITGVMSAQGLARTPSERRALALYLSGKPFGTEKSLDLGRFGCKEQTSFTEPLSRSNWNGWSNSPSNSRFQDAIAAGLDATRLPQLELK